MTDGVFENRWVSGQFADEAAAMEFLKTQPRATTAT
jgi:hypothetical protein